MLQALPMMKRWLACVLCLKPGGGPGCRLPFQAAGTGSPASRSKRGPESAIWTVKFYCRAVRDCRSAQFSSVNESESSAIGSLIVTDLYARDRSKVCSCTLDVLTICAASSCGKLWAVLLQQGLDCLPRAAVFAFVEAL